MTLYPLPTLVAIVQARSPFYQTLYQGLSADTPLHALPIIDQQQYWQANTIRDNRLLTGPMHEGIVFKSGGTTGAPKFSIYTRGEWDTFVKAFGEALDAGGLRDGERMGNLFYAGELYASFLFITGSLERARHATLHFPISGKADFEMITHSVEDFQIDVLAGTPTTFVNLAEHLISQGMTQPWVRRLLFGGESMYRDQRDTLKRAFPNAEAASIGYASVDAGLLGYADADCGPDEHRVFDRYTLLEIVDDETGEPITEANRAGRILITNLTRLLMPVIRYPAGDRGMWLEPQDTPNRKFRIMGRSDEGARIGPITLYVEDVWQVLAPFRETLQIANFQLLTTHEDRRDKLTLKLAAHGAPEALRQAQDNLTQAIYEARPMFAQLLSENLIHPLEIQWVQASEMEINPRTGKLRRVLDLRHVKV